MSLCWASLLQSLILFVLSILSFNGSYTKCMKPQFPENFPCRTPDVSLKQECLWSSEDHWWSEEFCIHWWISHSGVNTFSVQLIVLYFLFLKVPHLSNLITWTPSCLAWPLYIPGCILEPRIHYCGCNWNFMSV